MPHQPTGNPPGRPRSHLRTNLEAAKALIRTLDASRRLRDVDEGVVTNLLTLAEAVDANPAHGVLRNEYRMTLAEVGKLGESAAGGFDAVILDLQAEVRDAPAPGKADAGRPGRRNRAPAGDAADAVAADGSGRRPGARRAG